MLRTLLVLSLLSSLASAAPAPVVASAPDFNQSLVLPLLRLGFDASGKPSLAKYAAGPGYALSWNFLPSADKSVRYLGVGVVGFISLSPSAADPGQAFALSVGPCVGVYNNLFRLCETYDLINAGSAGVTGLLANPTKQNLATVISFGLSFDFGGSLLSTPITTPTPGVLGAWKIQMPTQEPPGFWRW